MDGSEGSGGTQLFMRETEVFKLVLRLTGMFSRPIMATLCG